jgi:hypothetical protein
MFGRMTRSMLKWLGFVGEVCGGRPRIGIVYGGGGCSQPVLYDRRGSRGLNMTRADWAEGGTMSRQIRFRTPSRDMRLAVADSLLGFKHTTADVDPLSPGALHKNSYSRNQRKSVPLETLLGHSCTLERTKAGVHFTGHTVNKEPYVIINYHNRRYKP